jgi:hypothetical protein
MPLRSPSTIVRWTLNTTKRLALLLVVLLAASPAAAQQPINWLQLAGTAVDVNSGNKSAGTLRVVLATDQPDLTTTWKVDWTKIAGTTLSVNNGTADAGTLRVTVASNSTGVLGATQSGTWNITNISGTVSLPTLAATSTKQSDGSQKTQIVDGSGNVIASTSNNLNVQCANCSGSGVSTADEAAFTAGSSLFAGSGGFFQTTATNNALTTGQQGMLQLTAQRAAFVNFRNASGTEIGTASNPVQVSLANTGANATKILVTPDSVALPANQSTNVAQFGGTNVSTGTGAGGAGIPRVTISNDSSLAANQSVNVAQMNGVATTMGNGVAGTGVQRVAVASDNTPFETIPVATATTTDATSTCYTASAASTNSTNCKASAGNLYAIHVTNTTTTNYFLRLYNSGSAPTCSSATGFVETVPALGASANGGVNGRVNQIPQGFSSGIGFCLTGGSSSTDNTNAATGVTITLLYK